MAEESLQNNFFNTEYLKTDLKGRSVQGGALMMIGQFASRVIQIGATMILARLLTPDDYGLYAMIVVVTGFMLIFQDLGLSMATVQRESITHEQVNALFWIGLGASAVVMLVVMALAPVLVWFYGKPQLLWLTVALSVGFLFGGLAIQPRALLKRQMRFGTLAGLNIAAITLSIVVGIGTAWAGAGVWALVYMELARNLFTMVIVWIMCPWRPSFTIWPRGQKLGSMLAFGGNLTGFNIVNYFARSLDHVLIGRFCALGQLGLYSKAYDLMMLPIIQVSAPMASVAIPTLSRLQNDPKQFRNYYLKAISFVAFITMPGVMFMVVMSEEIIGLVLGDQWVGVSRIFAILGLSALIQPLYNTQGWLHIATGRTDRVLRWGIVGSAVIISSFFVGISFGALGVATCYTVATYLIVGPCLWYAGRPIELKLSQIVSVVWKLFISAVGAGVICKYLVNFVGIRNPLARIGFGLLLLLLGYVIFIGVLHKSLSPLKQFFSLFRYIRAERFSESRRQGLSEGITSRN